MSVGEAGGLDFFISYTTVNEAWARWIAAELERAGYTTVSQALDFRPGHDFVHSMQVAVTAAARTVAVLSPAYLASEFGQAEWRAAFADDPTGAQGLLVPVRVQRCRPPGLLGARVYVDLVDADERTARRRLLDGVGPPRPRPSFTPFPGRLAWTAPEPPDSRPRFPGAGPEVDNLPWRNRSFTGRDELLQQLHERLQEEAVAAVLSVEAVHGLGGIGKTELVLEFSHRFAGDYDITWVVPAEQPATAAAALAGLAERLGLSSTGGQAAAIEQLFAMLRGRDRWLLIYDNAEHPDLLDGLLPTGGGGSVLVTSRWSAWSRLASPLRLDVLTREESVRFLGRRVPGAEPVELYALAELLGDLPLALDEAAAYLEATNVALRDYLGLVRERASELFGLAPDGVAGGGFWGDPDPHRRRVATVWAVSLERVRIQAPAAEQLLALCALLGPEIPRSLFADHAAALPDRLAAVVRDPLTYNATLAAVGLYSLAAVDSAAVGVHRLVQAVIRARLPAAEEQAWARAAIVLLRAAFPGDIEDVGCWPECERVLPHVLVAAGHADRLGVAPELTGWLYGHAATYLRERGHYRQALPLARRGVKLTASALGAEHAEAGIRHEELGLVLWCLGALDEAREQLERALRISEAALGSAHQDIGTTRSHLGLVLHAAGDLPAAREQLERALRISETALGPDHTDVGIRRNNLGLVLRAQGDLDAARAEFERALLIRERTLGPGHPDIGIQRGNLGLVLKDQGRFGAARTQYERALQIGEASLGPDHPRVGILRHNLGELLRASGDLDGARDQLRRALRICSTAQGPDHSDVAVVRNTFGLVFQDAGDVDAARGEFEAAVHIGLQVLGHGHPEVGSWRMNLGLALQALGDLDSARDELGQALRISEAALGADHPQTGAARDALHQLR